jgi:long-chain acyl-CoA synthetase
MFFPLRRKDRHRHYQLAKTRVIGYNFLGYLEKFKEGIMTEDRPWHRSYHKDVPVNAVIEKITMPEILDRTAATFPDRTAFLYMGKKITFQKLLDYSNRFAKALLDMGVQKGDKIGMILPNIPQAVIANQAAYRVGAVTAMNNPLYTERELQYQLDDSDAKVVVTLDLLLPRVLKIKEKTKVEKIVFCHINDFLPFPKKQLFPFVKKEMFNKITPQDNVIAFMDCMKHYDGGDVQNLARWDEPAAILYTGGTTGVSKGAVLNHSNISSTIQQFVSLFFDLREGEESILGIYPIFHVAGYNVSQNMTILKGWTCILIPRPEPNIITDMLLKYKPTFLPGVPTIYTGLLNNEKFRNADLSFVKGYFGGAAPLPQDTVNRLKKLHGAVINDVYGSTETTAFVTCMPWRGKIKSGTVGIPIPGTDVKIVDIQDPGKPLPIGSEGEICAKGPQIMQGYYKKPEETGKALVDGWFHTGDIGRLDEEGYLTIVDRKKDMIICSGYNVYPNEIDEVLFGHPLIVEACAIGVPDEYRGETIRACVVKAPGADLAAEEVISFCRERLAAYKVPKEIVFLDALPKSTVGKILRRELREAAITEKEEAI